MIKKLFYIVFIMLLILVACDGGNNQQTPSDNNLIIFNLGKEMVVRVGEEFNVTLRVTGAYEMTGISANFAYDPAFVAPVDTDTGTPGTQFNVTDYAFLPGAAPMVAMQQDAQGNEQPGTVITSVVLMNPNDAVSSEATENIWSIRFVAMAPGTSTLTFSFKQITDIGGDITNLTDWASNDLAEVVARTYVELVIEEAI
jgi:hypothetical protein